MRPAHLVPTLGVACVAALAACAAAPRRDSLTAPDRDTFVGAWRLVSFESRSPSGAVRHLLGPAVEGRLTYDAQGRVSAHHMRPDRPRFASGDRERGTDAEVRAAFLGYVAYYGTYTIDLARGTVTHRIAGASFPNWVGTEQVRHFRFEGRRLTLTTPPIRVGGEDLRSVLVWERLP